MSDQAGEPQTQIIRLNAQVKGMTAQTQALRNIINDHVNAHVALNTNMILTNQAYAELQETNRDLGAKIDALTKELNELKTPVAAVEEITDAA